MPKEIRNSLVGFQKLAGFAAEVLPRLRIIPAGLICHAPRRHDVSPGNSRDGIGGCNSGVWGPPGGEHGLPDGSDPSNEQPF